MKNCTSLEHHSFVPFAALVSSPPPLPSNIGKSPYHQSHTATDEFSKNIFVDFNYAAQHWLNHTQQQNKGATLYKYQYLMERHILPRWGNHPIDQITVAHLNRFAHEKLSGKETERPLSKSYVRSMMLIIDGVMKCAADEGWCPPIQNKIYKPSPDRKAVPILGKVQQARLEDYVTSHPSAAGLGVLIALQTGLRIGEICALTWSDIDFDNELLYVRSTISRVSNPSCKNRTMLITDLPKTNASVRTIPCTSILNQTLRNTFKTSSSAFVLSNNDQFMSPRTLEYRYHKILRECALSPITFHALRHTFATRCIECGVDVKSLSEILGHASVSITLNTYVHSSLESKRKQLEKMTVELHKMV